MLMTYMTLPCQVFEFTQTQMEKEIKKTERFETWEQGSLVCVRCPVSQYITSVCEILHLFIL